jgi:hypothetical protein
MGEWGRLKKELHDWLRPWEKLKREKGKGKAEKGIASGCALPSNGCYGARVERCQGADPPQAAPMGKLKREKGKLKREN